MSTLDAVGFVANFAAMVIGSAVLLLTLWQSRRLTNLVLGVFLSAVIINSAALMLVRVTQLLALDLMLISKTVAAASGTYGILFFAFGMVFIRDTPRWAVPAVLGSAVLWGVGQWFIWTDRFLRTVTLLPSGRSPIGFTPIGFVLITLLLSYLGLTMVMIIRSKDDRARTLIVPLSLLILATLSNVIPPFSELPVFGILVALSVVTLGRVIIHDRMMNPIIELNDQLEQANAELERANMLKTQFMATMSHELRTPLNAIIGFSQMLAEGTYGELNERQSERLHVVLSNADHLLQLINDVLDLSKIEAGRIILQFEPVDPIRVIQDVLVQFRQDAARKNLYLTLDTAPDLPEVVVDETRLRQIMFNLMSNAV
ncbi:MAG: sensor histidine kinase [Anaerolineae bacterium]